jgi:DNA topoisomerase IB
LFLIFVFNSVATYEDSLQNGRFCLIWQKLGLRVGFGVGEKVRNEVEFNRLASFGQALPGLRTQLKKDLQAHKLSQQKVAALVVRLLDDTLLRIGNPVYAAENKTAQTEQEGKINIVSAVQHAAEVLGNTPAVCRQYYIHPAIAEAYLAGELTRVMQSIQTGKMVVQEGLSDIETAVILLLPSV